MILTEERYTLAGKEIMLFFRCVFRQGSGLQIYGISKSVTLTGKRIP